MSNLLIPLTASFSADDLALILGSSLPDAVAVVDPEDGRLLAGNQRLEDLLGLKLEGVEPGSIRFEDLIDAHDLNSFRVFCCEDEDAGERLPHKVLQLRLRTRSQERNTCELSFVRFRWKQRDYIGVYIRKLPDPDDVTKELREKVAEQKRKTIEAVKSSLLIYQFTEKIKKTPVLTTTLLSTENEEQLFERASTILTGEGLNYKDVTFLIVKGDRLETCYSTKPIVRREILLSEEHTYTAFIRDSEKGLRAVEREVLVPLRSRGNQLGVLVVSLHPRERIFFDEVNLISGWQKDALLTIGDMIALLLDNLWLYREVRRRSITDTLTGVFNRHYFIGRLSSEINRCSRSSQPVSLIFIDVDEFKRINDHYGHIQGDEVLKQLGEIFRSNIREYDCVCRYGGDEFVILLPETGGEQAQQTALKLLERVREHQFFQLEQRSEQIKVSVSIGVSQLDQDVDEDLFLKSADNALYKAKEKGRNQVVFADASAH